MTEGKFLGEIGLNRLIQKIKAEDAKKIEKVKLVDTDLVMVENRVTIPLVSATSSTEGAPGLMSVADKWKLDHSEASALAGVRLNGTLLTKNTDNEAVMTVKQNGTNLVVDSTDKSINVVADANIIESVKQNGTALTITDKSVDVDVPIMTLYKTLDGVTETQITPDANHKAVINLSDVIPTSKIESSFEGTISATDTVAQAKAIKEYVDSKIKLAFTIVDNDTTKDVYYVEDSTTHVRTITKKDAFTPPTNVIYLVPEYGSRAGYVEYFWNTNISPNAFEQMGRTDVDLSQYVKYTDISSFTANEIDTLWGE